MPVLLIKIHETDADEISTADTKNTSKPMENSNST